MGYRRKPKFTRSRHDRMFTGLIGGIGEHLDFSSFWLRVLAVFVIFSTFPIGLIAYIVCSIMVPKGHPTNPSAQRISDPLPPLPVTPVPPVPVQRTSRKHKIKPQPMSDFKTLESEFDAIEDKIRRLEDYVTSKEFQLNQKFENL